MKKSKKELKFERVMREFKAGTLKSSSGRKVVSRSQAIAIAASESGMRKKKEDDKKKRSYTRKKR